jgi:two-component system phosphate regulon sensor histidine kinase PhoR
MAIRAGFRTKVFGAVFGVAAAAVLVTSVLLSAWLSRQTYDRIEQTVVSETRLVAEVVSQAPSTFSAQDAADEARRIAHDLGARVTFIAADGHVIGDSAVEPRDLPTLENHATRPEVIGSRRTGVGVDQRRSHTIGVDLLYVAMPVRHPVIATVRLALPLTEIQQQTEAVQHATLVALGVALAAALVLAWVSSILLGRRLRVVADTARRYAAGDLTPSVPDRVRDELGTVASVLDDTVRRLGARLSELARDRARTDAILSGMQEGVLMVDARGHVQLLNRAACEMLKLDDGAVGHPYVESIRQPQVAALLGSALQGDQRSGLELTPSRNPERTLVARAAPVVAADGNGAVLVLHDITDLRRADQVRRDFVANVSHELRTPLTAIRGYVEALRDEAENPAERARFLEIVARHTERMERLVKDLLRLARLEARQEPIEMAPCSIEAVLGGVVADLSSVVAGKAQRTEILVDPEAGSVTTDAAKLQDALRNILENAAAYSPPGTLIRLRAAGRGNRVELTVEDEGPGIPEADLARIFERFYRVDKARSRESGGTGLGLSIVKHLVERLSGEVWAVNRPGGGAAFTILIPRSISTAPRG